jgi:soluble lytic murein transglycosylase-like protein
MYALLIGIGILIFSMYNTQRDIQQETVKRSKKDYDKLYIKYGDKYDLEPELIKAHAIVESSEDHLAVGPTNDYGLMQVVFPQKLTAVTNWSSASKDRLLNDPDFNVDVATQIMKWNHSKYSFKKAIAVYNMWGAHKAPPDGPFPNQDYVDKVMHAYSSLIGTNYFNFTEEKFWQ